VVNDGKLQVNYKSSASQSVSIGSFTANQADPAVFTIDTSEKVDKIHNPLMIYGTDAQGEQTGYSFDSLSQVDDVKIDAVSLLGGKKSDGTPDAAQVAQLGWYFATKLDKAVLAGQTKKKAILAMPTTGEVNWTDGALDLRADFVVSLVNQAATKLTVALNPKDTDSLLTLGGEVMIGGERSGIAAVDGPIAIFNDSVQEAVLMLHGGGLTQLATGTMERTEDRVSAWNVSPTNGKYPSELLVYQSLYGTGLPGNPTAGGLQPYSPYLDLAKAAFDYQTLSPAQQPGDAYFAPGSKVYSRDGATVVDLIQYEAGAIDSVVTGAASKAYMIIAQTDGTYPYIYASTSGGSGDKIEDNRILTQKAIRALIQAAVTGTVHFRGVYSYYGIKDDVAAFTTCPAGSTALVENSGGSGAGNWAYGQFNGSAWTFSGSLPDGTSQFNEGDWAIAKTVISGGTQSPSHATIYYKGVTAAYPNSFDVVQDNNALPDEIDTTLKNDGSVGFKRKEVSGKQVLNHTSADGILYDEASSDTIKQKLDGKVDKAQGSTMPYRLAITDSAGNVKFDVLPAIPVMPT
jgi:hypothetical protein